MIRYEAFLMANVPEICRKGELRRVRRARNNLRAIAASGATQLIFSTVFALRAMSEMGQARRNTHPGGWWWRMNAVNSAKAYLSAARRSAAR